MSVPETTDATFARDVLAADRPVLVEFTADWCGNCLALESTVFHDHETVQAFREHGFEKGLEVLTRSSL